MKNEDSLHNETIISNINTSLSDSSDMSMYGVNENLVNLDDVDVTIYCEVGRALLTLAEVSKLKLNDTITINKWPNSVLLKLNNQNIAEGVLVALDGHLGVKIIKMFNNK